MLLPARLASRTWIPMTRSAQPLPPPPSSTMIISIAKDTSTAIKTYSRRGALLRSRRRAVSRGRDSSGSLLNSYSKSDAKCDAKCHGYSEDYNGDDELWGPVAAWRRGTLGFPCWCVYRRRCYGGVVCLAWMKLGHDRGGFSEGSDIIVRRVWITVGWILDIRRTIRSFRSFEHILWQMQYISRYT